MEEDRYKILLIDDDANCLDAVDQILRREGYDTLLTENGKAAAKMAAESSVDLAIVDYNMPEIDGLRVLQEIRRERPDLPVLLMTAEPSQELELASIRAGAFSFISKPINIPVFKQIVAEALQASELKTITMRRSVVLTRWIRWIKKK